MYKIYILLLTLFIHFAICRDFYVGMFKKNDYLVAQDRLYKEKVPFRSAWAKYGRHFKCPITYFRVVDRLGMGRGPRVDIVRGGLRKKYIVLRLIAPHNLPISVNIYVGCENKQPPIVRTTESTTTTAKGNKDSDGGGGSGGGGEDSQNDTATDKEKATTTSGDDEKNSSDNNAATTGDGDEIVTTVEPTII